uniref:Uncharacterized protein n=1 Tax=Triticum urartu TaxID=4572 RepID=A0A8R7PLF7_TRIUA
MGAEVRFSSRDAGVVGRVRIRRAGVVGVAGSAMTGLGVVEESRSSQPSGHGDPPDPVAVEAARSVGSRRAVGVGAPVRRGGKPPRHAGRCSALWKDGGRPDLGRARSMILVAECSARVEPSTRSSQHSGTRLLWLLPPHQLLLTSRSSPMTPDANGSRGGQRPCQGEILGSRFKLLRCQIKRRGGQIHLHGGSRFHHRKDDERPPTSRASLPERSGRAPPLAGFDGEDSSTPDLG